MIKRILAVAALAGVAFVLNGCGGGCTDDRRDGLQLTISDYETGLPMCSVQYKVTSGSYIEEGTSPSEGEFCNRLALLEERPGSYSVEIQKEGYNTVTFDVDIFSDQCHVITERRDIDLEEI